MGLVVVGSVIYMSLIVRAIYQILHYWDYCKQEPNTQKLDFLLKSHKQAAQIKDLIDYVQDPIKHAKNKKNYSKGVLFTGGMESLFVQALSNELNGQCFHIDVYDFIGRYEIDSLTGWIRNLHESAGKVSNFFNYIKRQGVPCLIILKNLEGLIPQKFSRENIQFEQYINEEIEAIKNQLLIETKKLADYNDPVICSAIISDTKILPITLTPAFTNVLDDSCSLTIRAAIIEYLFKAILKHTHISSYDLALRTSGFTEKKLISLREQIMNSIAVNVDKIKIKTASEIIDDVMYGTVRNNDDPELTAYHESGHAIIIMLFNTQFTLDKVSTLARDKHLGLTRTLSRWRNMIYNQKEILNEICMCLAGYAGEELFLSKNTIWTESTDYKDAYKLACIVAAEDKNADPLKIIEQEYERALNLLKRHRVRFTALAQALVEHKVLMADEIYELLNKVQ
ncbi:MAG: hypothetical protein WC747_01940 [Candidatus Babeliales bacterium]